MTLLQYGASEESIYPVVFFFLLVAFVLSIMVINFIVKLIKKGIKKIFK